MKMTGLDVKQPFVGIVSDMATDLFQGESGCQQQWCEYQWLNSVFVCEKGRGDGR